MHGALLFSCTESGLATDLVFPNADPCRLLVGNVSEMAVSALSASIVGVCLFLGLRNISEGHERGCISEATSWLPSFNVQI